MRKVRIMDVCFIGIVIVQWVFIFLLWYGKGEHPENGKNVLSDFESWVVDPTFQSSSDIYRYRAIVKDRSEVDSVFMSLSSEMLMYVTHEVLKRRDVATKSSIVREYLDRSDYYKEIKNSIDEMKDSMARRTMCYGLY